jgi:hypothetical protein
MVLGRGPLEPAPLRHLADRLAPNQETFGATNMTMADFTARVNVGHFFA